MDAVLANYFEMGAAGLPESVEAIRRSYEDVKAGRTRPAAEFLEDLREKPWLSALR
ncbi:MAG: hypothetical protein ACRD9L_07350 [Bryobacteraceae bacterium]